jgi:hypothetical protein
MKDVLLRCVTTTTSMLYEKTTTTLAKHPGSCSDVTQQNVTVHEVYLRVNTYTPTSLLLFAKFFSPIFFQITIPCPRLKLHRYIKTKLNSIYIHIM